MLPEAFWRSAMVRALIAEHNTGALIRVARQRRGWRQADLGKAVGYSASTISRLETGRRASTDLDMLRAVTKALGVPPALFGALMDIPLPSPATVTTTVAHGAGEDDPMRRRTLMAAAGLAVPLAALTGLDDALALLPEPARPATPPQLATRLARARRMFDTGDLADLISHLPDLLATAHETAEHHDDPRPYDLVASCYDLAAETLNKIGAVGSSRITADRATAYAARSEDPVAMAAAARSLGIVLRHEGRQALAERVTLQAADRLDQTGLVTPGQAAAYAQMLCTCAYNAAQADDRARALDLIAEAGRAAERLPAHPVNGLRLPVNAAQVALYEVGVHWSLGDAGNALRAGRGLRAEMFPTPERRGRLHTDLARAWWQRGRPEETARALLAAYQHSPGEVRDRPTIRKIALDLTDRRRRVAGVRELTAAIGRRGNSTAR